MPYYDDNEQPEFAWACNWGKAGRERHPIGAYQVLRGKRDQVRAGDFFLTLEHNLLRLQHELRAQAYCPGPYSNLLDYDTDFPIIAGLISKSLHDLSLKSNATLHLVSCLTSLKETFSLVL